MRVKRILGYVKKPKVLYRKIVHRLLKIKIIRIIYGFPDFQKLMDAGNSIVRNAEGKLLFVFPPPSCPWGYLFQRPQQLARSIAGKGHTVLYFVDTSFPHDPDWNVRGVSEIETNLFLVNDGVGGRDIAAVLASHETVVLWQYWPHQLSFIEKFNKKQNHCWIYDSIDHPSTFLGYSGFQQDYQRSIKSADLVLCTAKKIMDDILNLRPDCIYVPNAVNIQDFQEHAENAKINNEKRVIGYYGAIAEWFDFSIIEALSLEFAGYSIELVGEVYPSVQHEIERLKHLPNVQFKNRVSYEEIPELLATFDVAILPFRMNEITESTSPVKVFEYLAGGKAVVSTNLPEVREIDTIFVARDKDEFIKMVSLALSCADVPDLKLKRKEIASLNTWNSRVEQVIERITQEVAIPNEKKNSDI